MEIKVKSVFSLLFLFLFFCPMQGQEYSNFIIIDQFGYRPMSQKIAVIKNPIEGFDSNDSFTPGNNYAVIDANNGNSVFEGPIQAWNNGNTDSSSGDKVWHFDFTTINTPGDYYILDLEQNQRSFEFTIDEDIYENILKEAFRTFYYQRAGFPKEAPYAESGWEDEASHIGPQQDKNCRYYLFPGDGTLEKDLHGGWYDAGDYNKYTNWTADYIIKLIKTYRENPDAFGDDYNIPESGNGRPDILDEIKWGLDYLLRLQNSNGSVISIVSLDHASPPSSATEPSLYGGINTSSALSASGAYASGALIFREIGLTNYADDLEDAALKAWDWSDANPNVIWRNNDSNYGSQGVGAGQQEVDDYGRFVKKLLASLYLYQLTGAEEYKNYFESNYQELHLFQWTYAYPFETANQEIALQALLVDGISEGVKENIRNVYNSGMNADISWPAFDQQRDPYLSYLKDYTWGSNAIKCRKALMFYDIIDYDIDEARTEDAQIAAEHFIHYIHGVNPLNFVYLSNMYEYGAEQGVNEFYHTWFSNGSLLWDRVGASTYGPAPGFVVGGPNPSYNWDGCCPNNCGSATNNAKCTSEDISPPLDQPEQKSYKDFNTSWPLNSWSISENSCGYQVSYIRLLSKYVSGKFIDCSTGNCATRTKDIDQVKFKLYPNPGSGHVNILSEEPIRKWDILDISGKVLKTGKDNFMDISDLQNGVYLVNVNGQVLKLVCQK